MQNSDEMIFNKKIAKNKYLTINTSNLARPGSWFDFNISFSTKGDHPGFRFFFQLYKYYLEIELVDNRHWDYKNNRFENKT